MSDMGIFRTDVAVENPARLGERRQFQDVLVDTGAELSWFPAAVLDDMDIQRQRLLRFVQASGQVIQRWTGPAIVHVAGVATADQVVFGESGDQTILGVRSLEGLNLMVDPVRRRFVDAGPMLA
jgi:predicted aspartyl protease